MTFHFPHVFAIAADALTSIDSCHSKAAFKGFSTAAVSANAAILLHFN